MDRNRQLGELWIEALAAKRGVADNTFEAYGDYPTGVQGNVVSAGVNEFIIPNYKQTWAGIRKIADAPEGVKHSTFKSNEYVA